MSFQFILLLGLLTAQNATIPEAPPIDFFTTRHGLVDNHITALHHEPNGYLWVGTDGGLSRFDGQKFDNFFDDEKAPTGKITAIEQSPDGRIWVASNRQLVSWQDNHFTLERLFDSSIRFLLMGTKGRLWVALDEGLALWSGDQWVSFDSNNQFPDFRITQIYEDKAGQLWVGLRNGGAVKLDPDSHTWDHFGFREGLPHLTVNHFLEADDGTFWVATHGGVAIWRDGQFQPALFNDQLPSPIIYRLFEDEQGGLWMTASNAGAARWDGNDLVTYNRDSGMASNFSVDFLQDRWGHVWVLCRGGVSMHFHGQLAALDADNGLQGRLMTTFLKGHDGLIWIGTTSGLNRYEEPRLKTYLHDPSDRLIQSSAARSIFTDASNRLWFPTFAGLGCKTKDRFQVFTEKDGLPSRLALFWLEKANGEIWVGTERGAAFLQNDRFQGFDDPALRDQAILNMVVDQKDRIWMLLGDWNLYCQADDGSHSFELIGRFEGVLDMEAEQDGGLWLSQMNRLIHLTADGQDTDYPIESITGGEPLLARHFDGNGNWWLGTRSHLIRFTRTGTQVMENIDGSKQHGILTIKSGVEGRVWFNTIEPDSELPLLPKFTGLGVYDGTRFRHYSAKDGLHPRIAHEIKVDNRGREWLLSNKGLSWIEKDRVQHLGVGDALAGNRPYSLFWDSSDHLWIGTNGGLNKRSGNLLTTLGPNDGLLDSHVYDAMADVAGAIWIRTRNGVQRYRENPNPPEIDLIAVSDGDRDLPLDAGLILDHNQNNLIFHLRGIHLGRGADQMHFAYKLRGKHKEWSGVTREAKKHFPGLSPDNYTFTVRAYNRDLESSKNPQVFAFKIRPPWWFSTWFLITAILGGTLLAYLLYRIRLRFRLEKVRVFSELQTAHDMQLSLMPKKAPVTPRLEIFGECEPAQEVGGDYFDFFWLDDQREELGIAVMDVAGKSMEAAIISVMASGLVCSEIGQRNPPATILSRINSPMYQKTSKKIFTTGLVGALHTQSLLFRWSNAGHLDPILIRNGKSIDLHANNQRDLPLGAVRQWEYREYQETLQPHDLLLIYTDGLTEACNKQGNFFGMPQLLSLLEENAHLSSKALVELLMAQVKTFSGSMPQYDDITLVAIKVKPDLADVCLT